MLQYYSQIVETDTTSLEFSRKFPTFTLRTMILSQICPSPSAMLSQAYFEAVSAALLELEKCTA